MKKIYTEVGLVNYEQLGAAEMGFLKPEEVRAVTLKGRIDTACTHLALPEELASKLGLRKIEKNLVRYANLTTENRWRGSAVQVEINGRRTVVFPVISVEGSELLVGNPVLEDMDLFVNTKTGELYPNPESPDMPLAELF